jgi:hypothetical protein
MPYPSKTKYKMISGRRFYLSSYWNHRTVADKQARIRRANGYYARVIETEEAYEVYVSVSPRPNKRRPSSRGF